MTRSTPKHTAHFDVLDGMRGIAAMMVAYLHSTQILLEAHSNLGSLALSVDFFFCLSGFVVAYAYNDRLETSMTFGDFLKRRIIRLYPMIFLGAALGGAVYVLGSFIKGNLSPGTSVEVVGAFLLLPTGLLFGLQAFPTNNPIWSLFFELFSNLFYAKSPTIRIEILFACLTNAALSLVALSYYYDGIAIIGFDNWTGFIFGFVRVGYPFLAGVLIFRLKLYTGLFNIPASFAILALVAALTFRLDPSWAYEASLSVFILPIIVIMGANSKPGALRPLMVWLGNISYPLYLLHQPIVRVVNNIHALNALGQAHPIILITGVVTFCCALSTLVFYAYDKVVRDRAARIFLQRPRSMTLEPREIRRT